ncbi:uncharacterized protein LOC128233802 [Mya arenaria]|uniref:uncharacterized protein LOC128233786 n=1 Tax=Mya arenaria TaxID=6604 RepID=UPI0022E00FE4|nr:uncharacterized protein LOC128233786 [Mya arenaria]XP_052803616.1 uncharacterized protein LOC128233802 [Mya arenaria]
MLLLYLLQIAVTLSTPVRNDRIILDGCPGSCWQGYDLLVQQCCSPWPTGMCHNMPWDIVTELCSGISTTPTQVPAAIHASVIKTTATSLPRNCSGSDAASCGFTSFLICSTRGKYFTNICEFAKAACHDPTIRPMQC